MEDIIFGAVRVSRSTQNIDRQIRNITAKYPKAIIVKEVWSGTKPKELKYFNRMYDVTKSKIANGETVRIVFDSVSRMSRNAEEGFSLYEELFNLGVSLEFLKEPHINTETYRKALEVNIPLTGTNVDIILSAVKKYLMELAKQQIKICFDQAQKEVDDLHKRTSEGMLTAKLAGKQIGRVAGKKYPSKKESKAKAIILKNSKDFGGNNIDAEVIKIAGISKSSYYKYKSELKKEDKAFS